MRVLITIYSKEVLFIDALHDFVLNDVAMRFEKQLISDFIDSSLSRRP